MRSEKLGQGQEISVSPNKPEKTIWFFKLYACITLLKIWTELKEVLWEQRWKQPTLNGKKGWKVS